jgi:NADPH:quinone reductase-like Zn-dependent oxidoreductase
MRAALLTGRGGPEHLVVRDDVAVPTPGDGEVLIEVAACGVNNTDINTRVGWYSRSVTTATSGDGFDDAREDDATWGGEGFGFPRIQGADPSGRVVSVGAGVDRGLVGRRVLVDAWIRDAHDPANRELAGYLGSEYDGGFAEFCVVPATNVYPHESDLSDVELASFPCSWSTAAHMLARVDLRAGQSIAVPGASGGVGSALVSLAKLRGARVVAVCGETKIDGVRALGADEVISRGADDVPAAATEANGGAFDVVADIVGGDDTPGWFEQLRRGGRYVCSGAIAGPVVPLDLRTLYLNDLEFFGATIYDPKVFAGLVQVIERGDVAPVVGGVFDLGEIHEAQAAFERKEHIGAIVVTTAV